jgi:ribosomal 30S subunit maturation factor RimM
VTVGRVGRPHGRDGSFWVEEALGASAGERADPLGSGSEVVVAGRTLVVERRAGTAQRPLLGVAGIETRAQAAALRGEALLMPEEDAPPAPGEWLVDDLIGARIEGLGEVRRVLAGPSCDVLEVGERGFLVPLVSDAVRDIDLAAGRIEVDRGFLGLDSEHEEAPSAQPAVFADPRSRKRGSSRSDSTGEPPA